ncbi:hypothetical protein AwWohl_04760 [Gammaproteobacteria bacterium]|nr:hypothetical protein AwWohl_04760 [Gammaproteobacteria bacterium]
MPRSGVPKWNVEAIKPISINAIMKKKRLDIVVDSILSLLNKINIPNRIKQPIDICCNNV